MFCTNCGQANPETGYFCVKCGLALSAPVTTAATPTTTGVAPAPLPSSDAPAPPASVPPGVPPGTPASAYSTAPPPAFARSPETSGKAIGSFICGFFFWIFPAAVAGIILGHLSLSEINKSAGRVKGRGLAIAGLVMGYGGVVSIPLILILAAIAIPNLLRARMAASEAAAVGSVRVLNVAAITYGATYGNGFPPSLETLGSESGAASCDHAQLLAGDLLSGQKEGYMFVYFLEPSPGGAPALSPQATANGCTVPGGSMYEIHADPVTRGTTGQRSFYTDQTGIIRWETDRPATADSNILE